MRIQTALLALGSYLLFPLASGASLLTDAVDFQFDSPCDPQSATQVTVEPDDLEVSGDPAMANAEFLIELGGGSATSGDGASCVRTTSMLGVNLDAESITLTAIGAQTLMEGEILFISGLDWVDFATGAIVGVELSGDFGGSQPGVTHTADSVTIDLSSLAPGDRDSVGIVLNVIHGVPEPGTLALFGLGLGGLGLFGRQRRADG